MYNIKGDQKTKIEHKEAYLSSAGLKRDDDMMAATKGEIAAMKSGQIDTSGQFNDGRRAPAQPADHINQDDAWTVIGSYFT